MISSLASQQAAAGACDITTTCHTLQFITSAVLLLLVVDHAHRASTAAQPLTFQVEVVVGPYALHTDSPLHGARL